MEYLFFSSGLFSLLFLVLLLTKRENSYSNRFLATLFFLMIISSSYIFFFYSSDSFYYVPFFSELNYAIPMLYGTILWFYTRSLIKADFSMELKDYLHFIPFFAFLIFLCLPLIDGRGVNHYKDEFGFPIYKLIITPFYLFAVIFMLNRYEKNLKNHYSDVEKMQHTWLSWITVGAIGLWITATIGYFDTFIKSNPHGFINEYYILAVLAIYLFVLGIVAFSKTDIFRFNTEAQKTVVLELEDFPIIEKNDLETEKFEMLLKFMKNEKPYLDTQLTLSKLSDLIQIPNYKLSNIINQLAGQNFHDFINTYRVEEVKEKLRKGEHKLLSMLGIASESGFNSKASFNRIFKSQTGLTPSQFLTELSKS